MADDPGRRRARRDRAAEPDDQSPTEAAEFAQPDEQQISLALGVEETPDLQATRAVFGEVTPEKVALADALRAREAELTEWLENPANRERLLAEPREALADVLPESVLAGIEGPPEVAVELRERLLRLEFQVYSPPKTAAMELFEKVWAHVAASPGNLTAFNNDVAGTVRGVDPAASKATVDEVIAAIRRAQGIEVVVPFEAMAPMHFVRTISTAALGPWSGERP